MTSPGCPPCRYPAACACEAGSSMKWRPGITAQEYTGHPFRILFHECRKCHDSVTFFAYGARKDSGGAMWGKYRDKEGHRQELPLTTQDYKVLLPLAAQGEPRA